MITIQGLNDRQRTIMDLLWGCSSLDQVKTLINALPSEQDQRDARSLVLIATMESLEEEGVLDDFADQAEAVVSRARSS